MKLICFNGVCKYNNAAVEKLEEACDDDGQTSYKRA